jgi:hypothetical protein
MLVQLFTEYNKTIASLLLGLIQGFVSLGNQPFGADIGAWDEWH